MSKVAGRSQSMRITQLRLKNFRGIKNLELNFDTTQLVVVLVGVNGAGKSSILDCMSSLITYLARLLLDQSPVIRASDLMSLYGDYTENFQNRDIHTEESSSYNGLSVVFDGNEVSWNVKQDRSSRPVTEMSEQDKETIGQSYHNQYSEEHFVSIYYSANRKPIESSKVSSHLSEASYIIDFTEFTHWFQKLEDLENETRLSIDNNHRDIKLESTRTAIYSMLGDGLSNLRMKRAIDKLTIHKANQEIELDWLSDGERGLLALAGDLARRLAITYPDSVNPLHEAGLVLIDEIELHLHPEWQRIIIQRLTQTFPGCQFIVTTHSPQVLSNVQPECIHILAIEDNNVVVKRPERSYGRDSNRILEDIMGVSKRPPEIEARILELFRIIHDGELDRAKDLIQDLATEIGIDEPELIRAASTIHRREVIGR
jgi:predicted ATP-binding protein involved in virulence